MKGFLFFFIQDSVFWRAKFKFDVHYRQQWSKNLDYPDNFFSELSRITDTEAGFPRGRLRWYSLRAFGASLRPTLLAISAIEPPKAWVGSKKKSTPPFLRQEVIHWNWSVIEPQKFILVNLILKPSIIRKMHVKLIVYPDYSGFPVSPDRNRGNSGSWLHLKKYFFD